MKIKRTVNGIEYEFTLTPMECYELWNEMQYANDVEDVNMYLEDLLEDEDFEIENRITRDQARRLIPGIAYRKRAYENNQWNSDHVYEAIFQVFRDYRDGNVNEKGERIAK